MTRDALREAAMEVMRAARRRLTSKLNIEMYVVYVLPNGDVKREVCDQSIVNSPEAKEIQFAMVRERTTELKAEAVIWVSDAWMLDPCEQEHRDLITTLGSEEWVRITTSLGVVESARRGMGVARETISVTLQTSDWKYSVLQYYERLGAGKRHIGFIGEPRAFGSDEPGAEVRGRGMSAFGENPIEPPDPDGDRHE